LSGVVLLRKVSLALLAAFALAPSAHAQGGAPTLLMPGVTYQKEVQFTQHGPVVFNVMTAPQPGGLYSLQPVLSNEAVVGRERVTEIQKRVSSTATVAGVNGDLFNWSDGHPSGLLLRNGVLDHPPLAGRTSVGIAADGTLRLARVSLSGFWTGTAERRRIGLNDVPGANGASLFTPSYGPFTPKTSNATEAVLQTFPKVTPNADVAGVVTQVGTTQGGTPIPTGGAVIQARGSMAARLAAEAQAGTAVTVRYTLNPSWIDVVQGLGGGPLLVANGKAVFRANEMFTTVQLTPRDPRTAIGQKADGKILLVAVDGRQPGYSVGLSNYDLAIAMKRFGAVWASALDAGGSTTMAFDGKLLNRPSDRGGERAVAEALLVEYAGVYEPPPVAPAVSPNHDDVAETQTLSYKLVRPSAVTATLVAPDKTTRAIDSGPRTPGIYSFTWTGLTADGALEPEGIWHFTVTATDDQGRTSTADRSFALDNTVGFLTVTPASVKLTRNNTRLTASYTLIRPAKTTVSIETARGVVVKTILNGSVPAGPYSLPWAGKDASGRLAYGGAYRVHVSATNEVGTVDLYASFTARR
jgi:hypothetical protein